jgi:hypothetical protein
MVEESVHNWCVQDAVVILPKEIGLLLRVKVIFSIFFVDLWLSDDYF